MCVHRLFLYAIVILLYSYPLFSSEETILQVKPLDGVVIEAVERYLNPKNHNVQLLFSTYPFNAYYWGFGFSGAYCYHINHFLAWNIIHGTYIFSVEKNLSAELAEKYGVNPETIERINGSVSTELLLTPIYGKFVLAREVVNYFRVGLSLGAGIVFMGTSQKFSDYSTWSVIAGIRLETQINESLSWQLLFNNHLIFHNDFNDIISFSVGSGIYF